MCVPFKKKKKKKRQKVVHHSAPLPPPPFSCHSHTLTHINPSATMCLELAWHVTASRPKCCHVISFLKKNVLLLLFMKGFRACVVPRKRMRHCDITHPHHALLFSDSACASSCHQNEFQIQRSKWLIDVRGELIYRV